MHSSSYRWHIPPIKLDHTDFENTLHFKLIQYFTCTYDTKPPPPLRISQPSKKKKKKGSCCNLIVSYISNIGYVTNLEMQIQAHCPVAHRSQSMTEDRVVNSSSNNAEPPDNTSKSLLIHSRHADNLTCL
jgi:hypothetical protein